MTTNSEMGRDKLPPIPKFNPKWDGDSEAEFELTYRRDQLLALLREREEMRDAIQAALTFLEELGHGNLVCAIDLKAVLSKAESTNEPDQPSGEAAWKAVTVKLISSLSQAENEKESLKNVLSEEILELESELAALKAEMKLATPSTHGAEESTQIFIECQYMYPMTDLVCRLQQGHSGWHRTADNELFSAESAAPKGEGGE